MRNDLIKLYTLEKNEAQEDSHEINSIEVEALSSVLEQSEKEGLELAEASKGGIDKLEAEINWLSVLLNRINK